MNAYTAPLGTLKATLDDLKYMGPTHPLAVELTELFQTVIDVKNAANGNNRQIISEVRKFAKDRKFSKKFGAIVYKHTRIKLQFKMFARGPSSIFAISFKPNEKYRSLTYSDGYLIFRNKNASSVEIQDHLEKVRNSIDINTGIVTDETAANSCVSLSAVLYFDIDSAFLADRWHEKSTALIANEVTAINLHEIGHILSVIYEARSMHRTLEEITAPVKVSIKAPKDLKSALKATKKEIIEAKKAGMPEKLVIQSMYVVEAYEDILKKQPVAKLYWAALIASWTTISSFLLMMRTAYRVAFFTTVALGADLRRIVEYNKTYNEKDGDFKHTSQDITSIEFAADNYVNAFGYGPYLISALEKMRTTSRLIGGTAAIVAPTFIGSCMFNYSRNMMQELMFAPLYDHLESHGVDADRYAKIQQGMLKSLKASDLPDFLRDDLIDQYTGTKNIIRARNKARGKHNTRVRKLGVLCNSLSTGGHALRKLFAGGDPAYNDLLDSAERLSATELIYQKARLARAKK